MATRRYFVLYDITSDMSFIVVDGKSEYGDLAHAKKRANEIYKKKVTWGKAQGNVTFGFIDDEAVFAIVQKVKPQTLRKKNPKAEIAELGLYADNLGPSSQGLENDVYEIRQKFLVAIKKGRPKKELVTLTKHAAHRAARAYSKIFGSGAYAWQEIFTDKDLNGAAKYLFDSWEEESDVNLNPSRRKKATRKKNPKGFIVVSFAPVYNEIVYALDSKGARMSFKKADAKQWKTQNGAGAAAVAISNGWGEPVIVAPVNITIKQTEKYFPGVKKRGKK